MDDQKTWRSLGDSQPTKWGVWCSVSGGVTGSRQSWAKSNGEILKFDTEEEAKALASKWQGGAGENSPTRFRYFAKPFLESLSIDPNRSAKDIVESLLTELRPVIGPKDKVSAEEGLKLMKWERFPWKWEYPDDEGASLVLTGVRGRYGPQTFITYNYGGSNITVRWDDMFGKGHDKFSSLEEALESVKERYLQEAGVVVPELPEQLRDLQKPKLSGQRWYPPRNEKGLEWTHEPRRFGATTE